MKSNYVLNTKLRNIASASMHILYCIVAIFCLYFIVFYKHAHGFSMSAPTTLQIFFTYGMMS